MASLNRNNFCRWISKDNGTEITTDGDLSQCSASALLDWSMDDTAPFGTNDEDWQCGSGVADPSGTTGPYTKGLSQSLTIEKGKVYFIDILAAEGFAHNQILYIVFARGSNYQITKAIDLTTSNTEYDYAVIADDNYTKVMVIGYIPAGGTFSTIISKLKVYELNEECYYTLPLYKDDGINIFGNFVLDDSIVPFSGLKVGLWSNDLGIYLRDIATINQIVISGDDYSFYFDEWIVPDLPNDNFRFVIYTDSPETILYLSNTFRKVTNTNYTSWIKYNNSVDTLGYLYESAPSFYNEFRVDLWTGRPNYNENVKGYETYEGDLIRVKSDIQRRVEFQSRFFDESAHEAFFSMLSHSSIEIDGIEYKKGEESYDIAWSEDDDNKIGNGIINLLEVDYSAAIKTC